MGKIIELYELTEQYVVLDEALSVFFLQQMEQDAISEGDQVTLDSILEQISALEEKIEERAENLAKIIKWKKGLADQIKNERKRLEARQRAAEGAAEWLTQVLYANMKAAGKEKIKTPLFTLSISANGGKQPISITDNLDEIPGKYLIPQPPKPNTEAIRELLAEKEVEWAHLEPRGEGLRIR